MTDFNQDLIKSSAPESWNVPTVGEGSVTGETAPISGGTGGEIKGSFGGFNDIGNGFQGANALFQPNGYVRLGQGDSSVIFDANDSTYRIIVGSETYASANFSVTKTGILNATGAVISGTITATSGVIGGWTISATTLVGGVLTLDSAGNIRNGKTSFTDSTHAGFYIGTEGIYVGAVSDASKLKYTIATGVFDFIGTVSSRSTVTVAATIDASGNVVTDLINARIDTSAATILTDFDFGSTNYAGAVLAGNVTWNSTTGAITGGSGVVLYRKGIVGVASGVTTFSIDAVTGSAIFVGTITSNAGAIGGFSIGSDYIRDNANSFGLASTVTGGDDVRFWAGDTFANRAIAPARIHESGNFHFGSSTQYVEWDGSALTIAGDLVNIDSATGEIQGDVSGIIELTAAYDMQPGRAIFVNSSGDASLVDASVAGNTTSYIGIAINSVQQGATARVQVSGVNRDLTGLTVGSAYFLQDGRTLSASGASTFSPGNNYVSQKFSTGTKTHVDLVMFRVARTAGGSGNVVISIQSDSAGVPSGVVLWSETVAVSTIPTAASDNYYYPNLTGLSTSTTYHLVINISGVSGTTFTWHTATAGTGTYSEGYRTSADGTTYSAASADALYSTVQMGFGDIGTTAGTNSKRIGVALSATELLLVNS